MSESWFNVRVSVPPRASEELERWFFDRGAIAVTQQTPEKLHVFEFENPKYIDGQLISVVGLFEGHTNMDQIVVDLSARGFDLVQIASVSDENWERAWLSRFKPACFGNRLWVVPSETKFDHLNKDVIRIDPGLAFGTGDHATTRLCLEQLDGISVVGKRVLDFGCGSGVLGIGAAIKGARDVFCFDIDPRALDASKKNASLNKVRIQVSFPKPMTSEIDLLFANLLAKPIADLQDKLIGALRVGGQLIVSGLLINQVDQVLALYEPVANLLSREELDGWVLLKMEKKSPWKV